MVIALFILVLLLAVMFAALGLVVTSRIISIQMRVNDIETDCNLRIDNMAEGNQILTREVRACQEKVDAINQPLPSGKGKKPTTANRNKEILDQSQRLLSKIQE